MTSDPSRHLPPPARVLVYLDANVLVASITRTLLLLTAPLSNFTAVWSPYAEREALRHQPAGATPISVLRERYGLLTVDDTPTRTDLLDTDEKDRPILAAAAAAQAELVITENIRDFGERDLATLSMSAAHPDLFLETQLTDDVYRFVLEALAENRTRPPTSAADIHAVEVARKLPQTFGRHRAVYGVDPATPPPGVARLQFRGVRCINCGQQFQGNERPEAGVCSCCGTA